MVLFIVFTYIYIHTYIQYTLDSNTTQLGYTLCQWTTPPPPHRNVGLLVDGALLDGLEAMGGGLGLGLGFGGALGLGVSLALVPLPLLALVLALLPVPAPAVFLCNLSKISLLSSS